MPLSIPRLVALVGLAATGAFATPVTASTLCDGRNSEITDGSVIVIERPPTDGRGVAIQACGRVDAPPEQVWPVMIQCDYFEEFLPSVASSKLLSRDGEVAVCETDINLPFPLSNIHSVTRNIETALESGGFAKRWTLVRGSYKRNVGSWTVLPWPEDANRTLLVYDVDIDPDSLIPDFILRRIQSSTAPDVFAAVRDRVAYCAERQSEQACRVD